MLYLLTHLIGKKIQLHVGTTLLIKGTLISVNKDLAVLDHGRERSNVAVDKIVSVIVQTGDGQA